MASKRFSCLIRRARLLAALASGGLVGMLLALPAQAQQAPARKAAVPGSSPVPAQRAAPRKAPRQKPPPGAVVNPQTGSWYVPAPLPPAPVVPTERPLAAALHFTREHSFYPSTSPTDPLTHQVDSVRATLEYFAPGESPEPGTFGVWWPEPQRHHLDDFTPGTTPHFRLTTTDSLGTVVRYYQLMGQPTREVFTGLVAYPAYCATRYPPGHPSAPTVYRPQELEADFTRAREVVLDPRTNPPRLVVRVPKVEGYHRFE